MATDLASLLEMFKVGPTPQEKSEAGAHAMARMGLGILAANRSGPTLQVGRPTIGNIMGQGGLLGMDAYQNQLKYLQDERKAGGLAALQAMQVQKLLKDTERQDLLQKLLSGQQPQAPQEPQPTVYPSASGPVTAFPVGLKTVESRPVDAPAPPSPNQGEVMKQRGQRLIEAGFLKEGADLIGAANAFEQKPKDEVSEFNSFLDAAGITDPMRRREIWQKFAEKKATHQPPIVNIDQRQDSEFSKKVGGELGQQYSGLMSADMSAPATIGKYQRLGQLLSNVNTGRFRGSITDLKAAAKSMGFDLTAMGISDDVAPAQAARALSNQIALELRNPAGGAGMPGALSDKDREFLVQSIPGLENDPGAIGKMIEYRVKLEQRAQQVAKMARAYRKKHGRFDESFYDELQEWSNQNPLFPDVEKKPEPKVIDFRSLR